MNSSIILRMGFLACIALILIAVGAAIIGTERNRERYFVETKCLVVAAEIIEQTCSASGLTGSRTIDLKNMTLTDTGNVRFQYRCYAPLWTVQYNITTDTIFSIEHALISGSFSGKHNTAEKELNKYCVNSTYTCYNDKQLNLDIVQWTKPSTTAGLICVLVGIDLIVVSGIGCVISRLKRTNHR